ETVLRAASGPQAGEFERTVSELTQQAAGDASAAVRAGIGQFYLGRPQQAVALLEGTSDGLGLFYLGQALSTLDRHEEAATAFEKADKAGYDHIECTLRRAGELRATGQLDEAEKVVRSTGSEGGASRAEYSYQMGCILADRGDTF